MPRLPFLPGGIARRRADRTAVTALSLVLLGRPADGEAAFRSAERWPWPRLATEILRSAAFREQVLLPFLERRPIPQQRLECAGFKNARRWLARLPVPGADTAAGWVELLAAFLGDGLGATVLAQTRPEDAAGLRQRVSAVHAGWAACRLPVDDEDAAALYLLLLNRPPENEAVAQANRGRPRIDLIGELLLSAEFRDGVLPRFLEPAALRRRLDRAELCRARRSIEQFGGEAPPEDGDWSELFAAFLSAEPAASLIWRHLPAHAPRLAERVLAVRRSRAAGRAPMDAGDVKAAYLLLLGRLPDDGAVYRTHRGRPRSALIAELLRGAEFRDLVMQPFLAGEPTPHDGLAAKERDVVRVWLEKSGLSPAAAGWEPLLADFLFEGCPATLLAENLAASLPALDAFAGALGRARAWGRSAARDDDVEALHLLLLAGLPEGEAPSIGEQGPSRGALAAALLRSPECFKRTLLPLLDDEPLPHRRLDDDALAFVRAWLAASRLSVAPAEAGWRELVAALLQTEPAAGPCAEAVAPFWARFKQKTAAIRRREAGTTTLAAAC